MATSFRFFLIFSLFLGCGLARFFPSKGSAFAGKSIGTKSFVGKSIGGHSFSGFKSGPSRFGPKISSSHFFRTVPGGPCGDEHTCTGTNEECLPSFGREVCLLKVDLGGTCDEWYETCVDSVCREADDGSGSTCVADDDEADTGELCSDERACLEGHDCKPCNWVFGEKRCVAVVDDGDVCDEWFQTCGPTSVCTPPADGGSAVCVPIPDCLKTDACPVPGCIPSDADCPCDGSVDLGCNDTDFPTRQHAQLCLEKCALDVHRLDGNNNGVACQRLKACIRPPVEDDAPECPIDNSCPPPGCKVPDSLCNCDGNSARCRHFESRELAQACAAKCSGDPHGLDGSPADGFVCENRPPCGVGTL